MRGLTIIVGGEIELEGGIIRPHDPELILKSYLRGDVVYQDMRFREKTAQGKRCAPAGIVARIGGGVGIHLVVERIDVRITRDIGHPQPAVAVLIQDEGFGLIPIDIDREANVQCIGFCRRVVSVAIEPSPVQRVRAAGGIGYHVMGGDVELIGRSLPEDIGARLFALVDDHASVFPDLVPPVEAVDMVLTSGVVVEDSPPDAIIPP